MNGKMEEKIDQGKQSVGSVSCASRGSGGSEFSTARVY